MNKTELIDAIANSSGLTTAESTSALDGMLDSITKALQSGDTVSLIGFGAFSVKERAARTGRNPQTGAEIQISASKNAAFKAGAKLKSAVNP